MCAQDFKECELCLNRVLELEPGHHGALNEMARLRRAEKDYLRRSKEMQRNMAKRLFPKSGDGNSAETAAQKNDEPSPELEELGAESESEDDSPGADNRMAPATELSETAAAAVAGSSTKVAGVAGATAGSYIYNNGSNIVLLLATSLAVVVVSVYIAVFAKYQ